MNYTDPENWLEYVEKLKTMPTLNEVFDFIKELYPNWIVGILPKYSKDYTILQKNWYDICEKIKVNPQSIIIVDNISFDDNHNLIKVFSELLTRSGFCVRRKVDFFPCNICGMALANESYYNVLKEQGQKVPYRWSQICEKC